MFQTGLVLNGIEGKDPMNLEQRVTVDLGLSTLKHVAIKCQPGLAADSEDGSQVRHTQVCETIDSMRLNAVYQTSNHMVPQSQIDS